MVTALWVIADQIDRKGIKEAADDALWLSVPAKLLRGESGRDDNVWLRECLDRLTGVKINGDYRGDPWGAVILAEWRIEQGGSLVRLLLPPNAVNVLRAPATFAKVEAFAAYKLEGHARRLYAALADKKNMRQRHWTFGLDELRDIFGVRGRKSYERFNSFRQRVLDPALAQVTSFVPVAVKITPAKVGRSITAIRFDWEWKTIDQARETEEENERHTDARRKEKPLQPDAPPLSDVADDEPELTPERRAELAAMLADLRENLDANRT